MPVLSHKMQKTGFVFFIALIMRLYCPFDAAYSVIVPNDKVVQPINMPLIAEEVIKSLGELSAYERSNKFFLSKIFNSPQGVEKVELELIEKLSKGMLSLPAVFAQACELIKQKKGETPECTALIRVYQAGTLQQAVKDPAKKDDVELVISFMKAGAPVTKINGHSENALHLAALQGKTAAVKFFIPLFAKNGLLEAPGFNGRTALHCAAIIGNVECVKALIDAGANLTSTDKNGDNALHSAARLGESAVVQFLIPLFAQIHLLDAPSKNGKTALKYAEGSKHQAVAALLREAVQNAKIINENFHKASINDDVIALKALLNNEKAQLTATDKNGRNALHLAAAHGKSAAVEFLIPFFVKSEMLEKLDHVGLTALRHAVLSGTIECIKALVDAGAQLTAAHKEGVSIMHFAALHGKAAAVQFLIPLFAKSNLLNARDSGGQTALYCAAYSGNVACIKALIDAGANFTIPDKNGNNALHLAASHGNVAAIEYLIPLFAKSGLIDAKGELERTPLYYANRSCSDSCIKAFINAGANFTLPDKNGHNALHFAALQGNVAAVQFLTPLFAMNGLLEAPGFRGRTALHCAAIGGNVECIKVLANAGAKLMVIDKEGNNALHLAAWRGDAETLQFLTTLFSKSGLLEAPGAEGRTPLHYAAISGNVERVKLLLDAGASIIATNACGDNALHLAALNGELAMVEFLIPLFTKNGLLEALGASERTALHQAAISGSIGCIKTLLGAGANLAAIDKEGMNVLHLASRNGRITAVQFLAPLFAQINLLDAPSKDGKTALKCAEAFNRPKTAIVLWILGATNPMDEEEESIVLAKALEIVESLTPGEFEGLISALRVLHESSIIVPASFRAIHSRGQARFLPLRKAIIDRMESIRQEINEGLQPFLLPDLESIVEEYLFKDVPQLQQLNSGSSSSPSSCQLQ